MRSAISAKCFHCTISSVWPLEIEMLFIRRALIKIKDTIMYIISMRKSYFISWMSLFICHFMTIQKLGRLEVEFFLRWKRIPVDHRTDMLFSSVTQSGLVTGVKNRGDTCHLFIENSKKKKKKRPYRCYCDVVG